jgi:hypothetical protein
VVKSGGCEDYVGGKKKKRKKRARAREGQTVDVA